MTSFPNSSYTMTPGFSLMTGILPRCFLKVLLDWLEVLLIVREDVLVRAELELFDVNGLKIYCNDPGFLDIFDVG